jgi:hypothetical protein
MNQKATSKLIHVATIRLQNIGVVYLLLRQLEPYLYRWFKKEASGEEIETPIWGGTSEEAIASGKDAWKFDEFQTINCGFRYTLPERDEVGANALFCQMAASYSSMNGVYFDEELGSNCIVQNASLEARDLMKLFS